ncbi:D-glycero-beta-D-manno-heptose 1,7-bisphosphate 7-phosphatase [Legionella spiritensis]|uniref:D,D-heptose 1,7-bisphosphate phosphatase n=1 Tax=Legionella spiritensis TaxID=452 RepID=A0A0W0YX60_LEGSP|nr:D-glycero-beta-D-manno-heptose 1,7-bisphosphate 7-phosphatase [Legionella spiritensis]KTD61263.1 D,D-heptose 1,7-bisphosphate phosphatase [Legionella spiritensis]SNV33310.1 D,D-heptose 1,7-bisphosphate phosphatase [Legionella spiritensis]
MNKFIVLDRDGVINFDSPHYIKTVGEFIPIPGSIKAIARLTEAGYTIGIATNQSGIARGYYSEHVLADIHDSMLSEIGKAGGEIAAVAYCPHLPDTGCSCRKPAPGMLLKLADSFHCSPAALIFAGDRISDIQAAEAVGATPIMILSSMTDRELLKSYPHVPVYSSLSAYVDDLLRRENEGVRP